MNIIGTLNEELLNQPFSGKEDQSAFLTSQRIALEYARIENAIAVLSDLKLNKSCIYYGGAAETLGLSERNTVKEINSIWEEEIFSRIHPEDLLEKHMLELSFFHLLKSLPLTERSDYQIISKLRMLDNSGKYIPVCHRMFYICNFSDGSFWLALCLYNFSYFTLISDSNSIIVNSATGDIIKPDKRECNDILSAREKEILYLIGQGKLSKEIAEILSISINTVNRHRQNILEKLRVNNSIEAFRIAEYMGLF
ncbi:response regulator transcription factor [Coprobacter sp.]